MEGLVGLAGHMSGVRGHVSRVRYHVSGVTCQVSHVRCHMSGVTFFFYRQSCEASRWRVLLSTGPTPSSLFTNHKKELITDSTIVFQEKKRKKNFFLCTYLIHRDQCFH